MLLYLSTGYQVLGIVCLDQLKGARHAHISSLITINGEKEVGLQWSWFWMGSEILKPNNHLKSKQQVNRSNQLYEWNTLQVLL